MNAVQMTCELDSADLRRLQNEIFPELLKRGTRTLQEQCVTSATFIAFNWQKGIPAVEISTIDSELEMVDHVSNLNPRFIKQGLATHGSLRVGGLVWTKGMMIAVMRTNPNSPYSQSTGNRWPLAYAGGLKGFDRWQFFQQAAERMQSTRHSSTNFLQAGVTPIIREGLASPYYRYNASFGSRREARADRNPLNTVGSEELGSMVIDVEAIVVTCSNNVGDSSGGSNDVLAAKHREALIRKGTRPLEEAIAIEVAAGEKELQIRFFMNTTGLSREMVKVVYF